MQYNRDYEEIIQPDNFIKLFKDLKEFEEWADLGSVSDIEAALKEFEVYELYEYCAILRDVMNSK